MAILNGLTLKQLEVICSEVSKISGSGITVAQMNETSCEIRSTEVVPLSTICSMLNTMISDTLVVEKTCSSKYSVIKDIKIEFSHIESEDESEYSTVVQNNPLYNVVTGEALSTVTAYGIHSRCGEYLHKRMVNVRKVLRDVSKYSNTNVTTAYQERESSILTCKWKKKSLHSDAKMYMERGDITAYLPYLAHNLTQISNDVENLKAALKEINVDIKWSGDLTRCVELIIDLKVKV